MDDKQYANWLLEEIRVLRTTLAEKREELKIYEGALQWVIENSSSPLTRGRARYAINAVERARRAAYCEPATRYSALSGAEVPNG